MADLSLDLGARRIDPEEDDYEPLTIDFTETDAKGKKSVRTVTFRYPGDGVLIGLMSVAGRQTTAATATRRASKLYKVLEKGMSEEDYDYFVGLIEDDIIDMDWVTDMFSAAMEKWSGGFPTQPSKPSSQPRARTGGRSTGRLPAGE